LACYLWKAALKRDFKYAQGLLCVIDGAKGFTKAVEDKFKECGFIQRCQQHKKQNVASYRRKSGFSLKGGCALPFWGF
jgi:putative transposase